MDGHSREINNRILAKLYPIINSIKQYHDHEAIGIEHVPLKGRGIIAVNHSLATYDIALLFKSIFDHTGRIPRSLADHLFFKFPYLGEMIEEIGALEGTQANAHKALEKDELIVVAPGGMREALRPSEERYQILWEKRKGFVRLAIETQSPIILAVCPKADDLYDVYKNPITAWAYRNYKIPLFFAKGMACSPIPKKIKLIHFLSKPLMPPELKEDPKLQKQQIDRFHKKVVTKAQELIGEAIAYRAK